MKLSLKVLEEIYGIARFESGTEIPKWAYESTFFSITKTEDELSIVCEQSLISEYENLEGDWRALKVLGPLDFSLVGILSEISSLLAECEISIFAISTYDTDYILLKQGKLEEAIKALAVKDFEIIL